MSSLFFPSLFAPCPKPATTFDRVPLKDDIEDDWEVIAADAVLPATFINIKEKFGKAQRVSRLADVAVNVAVGTAVVTGITGVASVCVGAALVAGVAVAGAVAGAVAVTAAAAAVQTTVLNEFRTGIQPNSPSADVVVTFYPQ